MPAVSYPVDHTGLSPANKVTREPHVLTEINDRTYRILIPEFAPLYLDNFSLIYKDGNGVEHTLIRDIHFTLTLPYLSASRSIGKMLYGGVAISAELLNGSLLMTYQTLGGPSTADVQAVREALYELAYNPRSTSWDVIANKPQQYPPVNHDHSIETIYGAEKLVESIHDVAEAIREGPNPSNNVVKHFTDEDNPHKTTKDQVQLGLVENLPIATDQEVADREPAEKYILLRHALSLFSNYNPGVSKESIGLGLVKNYDTAVDVEVEAKQPLEKYILLKHLTYWLSRIDKSYVGLPLVKNYDTATDQEVTAQTAVSKYVLLRQVLALTQAITKQSLGLGSVENLTVATDQEVTNQTSVRKYVVLSQVLSMFSAMNSATASKLQTPRSIGMTGDGTWSTSFDGSGNVTSAFTLANSGITAGTYTKISFDAKGRATSGTILAATDIPSLPGNKITSTLSVDTTGNAATSTKLQTPRTITVTGDGAWSTTFDGSTNVTSSLTLANTGITAGEYVVATYDAKGRATAGRALLASDIPSLPGSKINTDLSVNTSGNAATASKLAISRSVSMTGDGTWTSNFDGSANVSAAMTLASSGITAGEYVVTTHDAKGRATGGRALLASDVPSLPGSKINSSLSVDTTGNAATATKLQTTRTINGVNFDGSGNITINAVDATARIASSEKGAPNGVATLDSGGKIPTAQLPSYVDDVIEVANFAALPGTGESGKIYITLDTSYIYRWTGSSYLRITGGTGVVDAADRLATPRNIAITGDGTWTVSFDGTSNVSAVLTLANSGITAGEYVVATYDAKGRATTGRALIASDIPSIPGTKINSAISVDTSGNAATATKLQNVRSISATGDASWSVNFDGSGNANSTLTLAGSGVLAGTYTKVVVDSKGRVTSGNGLTSADVTGALNYTPVNRAGDKLTGSLNYASVLPLASGATVNIGSAASNVISVTGTATISSFGTISDGAVRKLIFTGVCVLTYNATSMILPGSANITTAAGDTAEFVSLGSGNWKCLSYTRAAGSSLSASTQSTLTASQYYLMGGNS